MPFRNKVKKAMGRGSSSPTSIASPVSQSEEISRVQTPVMSGSQSPVDREHLTIDPREIALTQVETNTTIKKKTTLSKLRSQFKREDPYKDWPEDIYKPHELPRAKYRRPVDPDHQQTLQSYSLRTAFADMRRKSFLSQYSPMGSRLTSRRGSFSSRLGKSAEPSRNHSIVEAVAEMDISETDASDVSLALQTPDSLGRSAPIPMRSRGNTITTTSTVPELVQSSSIDSDDSDSLFTTSQLATEVQASRHGGLPLTALPVQNFSKPFDGDELTRALTRKLMASAGQL